MIKRWFASTLAAVGSFSALLVGVTALCVLHGCGAPHIKADQVIPLRMASPVVAEVTSLRQYEGKDYSSNWQVSLRTRMTDRAIERVRTDGNGRAEAVLNTKKDHVVEFWIGRSLDKDEGVIDVAMVLELAPVRGVFLVQHVWWVEDCSQPPPQIWHEDVTARHIPLATQGITQRKASFFLQDRSLFPSIGPLTLDVRMQQPPSEIAKEHDNEAVR